MKFTISNITQFPDSDFFWVTVSIRETEKDELGTQKSCDVKVSLKSKDYKLSEIETLAIQKAKDFLVSASQSE
ncbi:hypothetical protein ACYTPF_16125 [Alteromonas sp. HB246098]